MGKLFRLKIVAVKWGLLWQLIQSQNKIFSMNFWHIPKSIPSHHYFLQIVLTLQGSIQHSLLMLDEQNYVQFISSLGFEADKQKPYW